MRWAGVTWRRWHAAAVVVGLAIAVALVAARREAPARGGSAAVALAPPPDDLLCDLYVASPNASWGRLQRGAGGAAGLLPSTLPGVLVAAAGLDPRLASELDGHSPIYGVLAGDPTDPGMVLALKLVDARRARALLVDEGAGYTTRDAGGATLLVPSAARARGAAMKLALAIAPNGYLLASLREADIERLGPYVTRTLPARPLPSEAIVAEIPRAALKARLGPKLEAFWHDQRARLLAEDERARAERGRAPDFGDPAAIVAVLDEALGRRLAMLEDLERVRVALDVRDDAVALAVRLEPGAGDGPSRRWLASMGVGDASALLALPANAVVALSSRDSEGERETQALELEGALTRSLGARLKEPERLRDVFRSITKARSSTLAMALTVEEGDPGVFFRARVRDEAAADAALRAAIDLASVEPFKGLFRVRGVALGADALPGGARASTAIFARASRPPASGPSSRAGGPTAGRDVSDAKASTVGVAWTTEPGTGEARALALSMGGAPVAALRTGLRPERTLGDEPTVTRFTSALGGQASTILLVQPLRLDPELATSPAAPLALAIGREDGGGFVRIDLGIGLVREAARRQMGL